MSMRLTCINKFYNVRPVSSLTGGEVRPYPCADGSGGCVTVFL